MTKRASLKPCYLSAGALSIPELPPQVRKLGRALARSEGSSFFSAPLVVACASELLDGRLRLPGWASGSSVRYLVVADIPEPIIPRVVSALDLRRPGQRLHLTRDAATIRRLLVSSARREPMLGIVDAFLWKKVLTLVTGDFRFRAFPTDRIPLVCGLSPEEQGRFEISPDGSYLHWPDQAIHLGVSQILQDADPMYLADIAIERNRQDHTGGALRRLREESGLRQSDIAGVSERQVRRIEEGISRLRVATAEKFAVALGVELGVLLDRIARYAGEIRASAAAKQKPARPATRKAARGTSRSAKG